MLKITNTYDTLGAPALVNADVVEISLSDGAGNTVWSQSYPVAGGDIGKKPLALVKEKVVAAPHPLSWLVLVTASPTSVTDDVSVIVPTEVIATSPYYLQLKVNTGVQTPVAVVKAQTTLLLTSFAAIPDAPVEAASSGSDNLSGMVLGAAVGYLVGAKS